MDPDSAQQTLIAILRQSGQIPANQPLDNFFSALLIAFFGIADASGSGSFFAFLRLQGLGIADKEKK